MILPAHLEEYQDWLIRHDAKALGTAKIYARFLTRCAEHYGETINEKTMRSDAQVDGAIKRVSAVVAERDRWAEGTFNTYDVTRNLVFALRAYARFAAEKFPSLEGNESAAPFSKVANDVPVDELPERLREQVSRLIRDTSVTREIKSLYECICQMCEERLEIAPGRYYAEGHHLRPLGEPHCGDDVRENVICVCPNCHVLLDYNAVCIELKKLKWLKHDIAPQFVAYHNDRCSERRGMRSGS